MVNDMTKKRKSKEATEKSKKYSAELIGLFLIVIGIVGFGGVGFGLAGAIIKKFAIFLIGEWWPLLLITFVFLGIYMIFKRQFPRFFSARLVGFYLLVLTLLLFSHYAFLKEGLSNRLIFNNTLDNFMERAATISPDSSVLSSGNTAINIGGGITGAALSVLFSTIFGLKGTLIVGVVLVIVGIIMMFDLSLADMAGGIFNIFKRTTRREKRSCRDEEPEINHEKDKLVITSVNDLKQHHSENVRGPSSPIICASSSNYNLPPLSLLDDPIRPAKVNSNDYIKSNKKILERVLNDFQINGTVVEIHTGPAVTQYEVQIPAGTKVSRVVSINKEIALALAAKYVRIQAPIPGKNTIGIEIPNEVITSVRIKEVLGNISRDQDKAKILLSLGKDIMGRVQTADITNMPHLLIAGSTGSGKSVCINSFIASILMRYRPDEVKLVMVDPKKVELSNYNGIPHLLCPVVTDPKKASLALQRIVSEMERRYEMFSGYEAKSIDSYNEIVDRRNQKMGSSEKRLPYIVVIIDELADLMLVAAKDVEDSITRITQIARAAGIHLIVATQRPSTDVITGIVKNNIPSRISFAVTSQIDSRTILDTGGAEKLLGKGDMLYLPMGENAPTRIQGCFISDDEIRRLIEYVSKEQLAQYDETITQISSDNHLAGANSSVEEYDDPLYDEIVEFAITTGKISSSLIQRRFRLGYNRAARIVDLLEERGIVGPANGSKPRDVLVKLEENEG